MIAQVLDGIGYAMEAINITQFFYEEAIQVGILAAGTAITSKNWNLAEAVCKGPIDSSLTGLWGFGVMYGSFIPGIWMSFVRYWMTSLHYKTDLLGIIAAGKASTQRGYASDDTKEQGNACMDYIGGIIATQDTPEKYMELFEQSPPCQKWFDTFKKKKGLNLSYNFKQALKAYFANQTIKNRLDLIRYFQILYSDLSQEVNSTYYGQPTSTGLNKITSSEKRHYAKKLWDSYNRLQKQAFRRLPGGDVRNGYDIFYKMLWKNEVNNAVTMGTPGHGFIQIGIGPKSEEQSYVITNNELTHIISDKPILVGSLKFNKNTGSLDPSFLTDIQRGKIYVLKDVPGPISVKYICGTLTVNYELIADSPKAGDVIQLRNLPIRHKTLYITVEGQYIQQIEVNTIAGYMNIRWPETFDTGGIISFKNYTPCEGATFKVNNEDDTITLFEETTSRTGLIRIGLTNRYEPYRVSLEHPDYGFKILSNLSESVICSDGYIDITNSEGWNI